MLSAMSRWGGAPYTLPRGELALVDTIEVGLLAANDRPALCRMLERSDDFPQQLLGYYRRDSGRHATLIAWGAGEILGVLTGWFRSDFFEKWRIRLI
ncbi:hypothetical protein [Pedococcus bigeumensis]|uniref:hypothetical protein n=1 Tax=Pedococcus bigeumensis TaxID=433644 RepID=UPI002FEB3C7A